MMAPRDTEHERTLRGFVAWLKMRVTVFCQTHDEVFRRNAGSRSLVGPFPVVSSARRDWQFAMLSVAAYGRSHPKRHSLPIGAGVAKVAAALAMPSRYQKPPEPDVDGILNAVGWKRWSDFPDAKLERKMKCSHLRAEVWENKEKAVVAVAFGGTVFTSGKDWYSNLRWFFPWHKDEYSQIVSLFAPDLVCAIARLIESGDSNYWRRVKIFSTGHSLGGGLAQQFAYALPLCSTVPRVSEVYAFDPSPVTGYCSVDPVVRESNTKNLKIGRIMNAVRYSQFSGRSRASR